MRHSDVWTSETAQKINCPVLLTRRLVLRLPHKEDIAALVHLANNSHITAQFDKMPYPFTRAAAEEFVERAENGKIGYYVYAVTCADSGKFIGCCGIGSYKGGAWQKNAAASLLSESFPAFNTEKEQSPRNFAATEVFLWLGEPYWHQGYGTEVAAILVDTAFRATELPALYARAREDNIAANRILGKCGFSILQRGGQIAEGAEKLQAFAYYGLNREAWINLRSNLPRQSA